MRKGRGAGSSSPRAGINALNRGLFAAQQSWSNVGQIVFVKCSNVFSSNGQMVFAAQPKPRPEAQGAASPGCPLWPAGRPECRPPAGTGMPPPSRPHRAAPPHPPGGPLRPGPRDRAGPGRAGPAGATPLTPLLDPLVKFGLVVKFDWSNCQIFDLVKIFDRVLTSRSPPSWTPPS